MYLTVTWHKKVFLQISQHQISPVTFAFPQYRPQPMVSNRPGASKGDNSSRKGKDAGFYDGTLSSARFPEAQDSAQR